MIAQRLGLRLQDNSAFVQQITAINMATSDKGVEFGWERGSWERSSRSATARLGAQWPATASS